MNVNCPTCKKEIAWSSDNEFRPFCCKRCQLIDLGQWANEEHAIPSGANNDAENPIPDLNMDIEAIEEMIAKQEKDFFNN